MSTYRFPADFEWGAATAAAQIEGAWQADQRGESIWDRFCAQPGRILNGDTTHDACDHYHRYQEDIEIMKRLGLKTYRLSLSWSRILPQGTGAVNPAGVAFYRRLLGALRAAGIKPAVTLYHWDLPQALEEKGGWLSRQTAWDFEAYARVCFRELGDLADRWITHNEPGVVVLHGYETGEHAPGYKRPELSLQVAHHLLLSHGLAVKAFHEMGCKGEIGITLNMAAMYPASDKPADRLAAEKAHLAGAAWYSDPVLKGGYPQLAADYFRSVGRYPQVQDGDFELIRQPIDFLGVNYYMGFACSAAPTPENPENIDVRFTDKPKTTMGWDIYPEGLYDLLKRLSVEYPGVPLYITENGAAYHDKLESSGGQYRVNDPERQEYLKLHLAQCARLCADKVPLKGYYAWSLLDNFEWAFGYSQRFGIVHVDYATQRRTIKQSGLWYAGVIAKNGFED